MNRATFLFRNLADKAIKILKKPQVLWPYLNTYFFSPFLGREPDSYVVSYPKCGVTWVRTSLMKYLELTGHQGTFSGNRSLFQLPSSEILKFDHDDSTWVPMPKPAGRMKVDPGKFSGKKVCFLVRHPGDVVVSSWYHLTSREHIYSKGLSDFIREEHLGIRKVIAFMNLWIEHTDIPSSFMVMTYESLRENPEKKFHELFSFFGIDVDTEKLGIALHETSFRRMQEKEMKGSSSDPWTSSGAENSQSALKVRKGKVGGYRDELSPEDVEYIEKTVSSELTRELPYSQKSHEK